MAFKSVLTCNCIAGFWLAGLRFHLTHRLAQRARTSDCFLAWTHPASNNRKADQQLTQSLKRLRSCRPVKQRRALLESNPPRDNWIERRRNKKSLRIWGGPNLPKWKTGETFISEP